MIFSPFFSTTVLNAPGAKRSAPSSGITSVSVSSQRAAPAETASASPPHGASSCASRAGEDRPAALQPDFPVFRAGQRGQHGPHVQALPRQADRVAAQDREHALPRRKPAALRQGPVGRAGVKQAPVLPAGRERAQHRAELRAPVRDRLAVAPQQKLQRAAPAHGSTLRNRNSPSFRYGAAAASDSRHRARAGAVFAAPAVTRTSPAENEPGRPPACASAYR